MARDVHDLADEIESRNVVAFHGLRREGLGADAAGCYLGLLESLGSYRCEWPRVQPALELRDSMICPGQGPDGVEQAFRQSHWQLCLQGCPRRRQVAAAAWLSQAGEKLVAGRPIDEHRLGTTPVRRNLQDGGAAQSAMREQQFPLEAPLANGDFHCGRYTCKAGEVGVLRTTQYEGHERRTARAEGDIKLASDIIAEAGSAHFGDGKAAGGY